MSENVDVRIVRYQTDGGENRLVMTVDCPFDEFEKVLKDMASPEWQTGMADSYRAAIAGLDLGIGVTQRTIAVKRGEKNE